MTPRELEADGNGQRFRELELNMTLVADHAVAEVMDATARAERAEHDLARMAETPRRSKLKSAVGRFRALTRRSKLKSAVGRFRALTRRTPGRSRRPETPSAGLPATAERLLLAFPYYPDNRWQDIVYSDLRQAGWKIEPLEELNHAALSDHGAGVVLHVNWTAAITQRTPDIVASASATRTAIGAIDEFQRRGGRVVWTVHNVLPHEVHHLAPELAVCRALAARADLITVLNPDTPSLVSDFYRLPDEKIRRLPHPSYLGEFADTITRDEARARFGLQPSDIALIFLGQLRPYKGLNELLAAFDRIRVQDPAVRLLIAGAPGPGFTDEDRRALLQERDGVIVKIGWVPDDEMQWWCRAADLMVLPYQRALNVSLVSVAATFGIPVAIRGSRSQRYLRNESWVRVLPEAVVEFADALGSFAREVAGDERIRLAAIAAARKDAPHEVSRQFRALLEPLVADAADRIG